MQRRSSDIFPYRDGQCSERVFKAVLALKTPLTYKQGYRKVRPPQAAVLPEGVEPDSSAETDLAVDVIESNAVKEVGPSGEVIDELAAAVDR